MTYFMRIELLLKRLKFPSKRMLADECNMSMSGLNSSEKIEEKYTSSQCFKRFILFITPLNNAEGATITKQHRCISVLYIG